jgi:hypothetical protein
MGDRKRLEATLAQKHVLRGEADSRLKALSRQAMHAEHDAFGVEQIDEKLGAVKGEIEACDVEIAQLEQQIAVGAES